MLTIQQEQNRILELTRQDNDTSEKLDTYYDQAMLFISNHLTAFYEHYAIENSVSTVQATQTIDSWGLKQWTNAIDELDTDDWLDDTKERAKAVGGYAGLNVGNLMSSVALLAIISLINKSIILANSQVKRQTKDEKKFLNNSFKSETPKKVKKTTKLDPLAHAKSEYSKLDYPSLSDNLWTKGDQLISDVRSQLFKHFMSGGDLNGLRDNIVHHVNKNQFNPRKSIGDRIYQQMTNTDRLLRSESAMMLDYMDDYSYKKNGIKYVNWVTEGGACSLCMQLAANGPYLIDEAPRRVIDSHPNCRCGKVPAADMDDKWNQSNIKADKNNKFSNDEVAALRKYISSDSYKINDYLRNGMKVPDEFKNTVKYLDSALDKAPNYKGEIYRSLTFNDIDSIKEFISKHVPGETINYSAFTSFSPKIYNSDDTIRIKIRNSTRAKDIRKMNVAEQEVLYSRNTKFRVVKRYKNGNGKPIIELEEVND